MDGLMNVVVVVVVDGWPEMIGGAGIREYHTNCA